MMYYIKANIIPVNLGINCLWWHHEIIEVLVAGRIDQAWNADMGKDQLNFLEPWNANSDESPTLLLYKRCWIKWRIILPMLYMLLLSFFLQILVLYRSFKGSMYLLHQVLIAHIVMSFSKIIYIFPWSYYSFLCTLVIMIFMWLFYKNKYKYFVW